MASLASAAADGSVRFWRLRDGECTGVHDTAATERSSGAGYFPTELALSRASASTGRRCVIANCNAVGAGGSLARRVERVENPAADLKVVSLPAAGDGGELVLLAQPVAKRALHMLNPKTGELVVVVG